MYIKNKSFLVFSFLIISFLGFGQGQGNSPYQAIGVGEISPESTAAQDMMGGTGVSFTNSFYINSLNPALISKNRTIGFNKYVAFNVGMKGAYRIMNQGAKIQENFGLNLANIAFVFPIKPKWASAVSIKPYTHADHASVFTKSFANSNITNNTEIRSTGGLSKVSWTNGVQVAKWLYLGLEGQYLFGNIQRDSSTTLSGSAEYFRNSSRIDLKGTSAKAGAAVNFKLNKKWYLNAGATAQLGANLSGDRLGIFSVLAENGNGPLYIQQPDTLYNLPTSSQLPKGYRVGISLEQPYKLIFSAEYASNIWTGTKQFESRAEAIMKTNQEYSFGFEWMPNSSSGKFLDQVFYRAGYRQGTMPYNFNGVQPKDRSFSLGFSLPMGFRSPSYIDLGVSIGRRGTLVNSLVQENYTKISVNFSLLSSWFIKPRIE
jgi:hypothetical protein